MQTHSVLLMIKKKQRSAKKPREEMEIEAMVDEIDLNECLLGRIEKVEHLGTLVCCSFHFRKRLEPHLGVCERRGCELALYGKRIFDLREGLRCQSKGIRQARAGTMRPALDKPQISLSRHISARPQTIRSLHPGGSKMNDIGQLHPYGTRELGRKLEACPNVNLQNRWRCSRSTVDRIMKAYALRSVGP